MIDIETIVASLKNVVRFRQTENPDEPLLPVSLTEPTTARLVHHPLLTNENISGIAPNYDTMNWPIWADGAYTSGFTVKHNDSYYVASEAIVAGETPGASPKWVERARLGSYMEERRKEAIRTVIMDIYNTKKSGHIARETLGDLMLYDGAGSMTDLIINNSLLVGLEIRILENTGLEVLIKQIGLQFSGAQTFDIYLWNSSQKLPIAVASMVYGNNYSVKWIDYDKSLKYKDYDNGIDNGLYYLGYYQDDLSKQAVRKRFNIGTLPCSTCSHYNRRAYQRYSQYVKVRAFQVTAPPINQELWDLNKTVYVSDNNWGLNLRIKPNCNITQSIVDNKEIFADVINHQLKHDLLLEMANSVRSNVLKEQVVASARGAIQPEHLGGEGVPSQLRKAKEAASLEMSDLERNVCMPKAASKGIVTRSI